MALRRGTAIPSRVSTAISRLLVSALGIAALWVAPLRVKTLLLWRGTLLIASVIAILFGITKVAAVSHYLNGCALVTVPVIPLAALELAVHYDHAALGKIFADKLCCLSPGHDIEIVRDLLAAAFVLEVTFHRHGKRGARKTALRRLQLWISNETAHDDGPIQHRAYPS